MSKDNIIEEEIKVVQFAVWLTLVTLIGGSIYTAFTGVVWNIFMIIAISLMIIGMSSMMIPILLYLFVDGIFGLNLGDKWVDLVLRGIFDRTLWTLKEKKIKRRKA